MSPDNRPAYPTEPLRPGEVLAAKAETLPDEVYVAVNGLITERLHGQYAKVSIKALIKRMVDLGLNKDEIKERGWDKIGSIYKQAGWDVSMHYPGDEDRDFDPYYSFNTQGPRSW